MSNETLNRAEQLLLSLLTSDNAIGPVELFARAAKRQQEAHVRGEDLKIALWSLISRRIVEETPSHQLRRADDEPSTDLKHGQLAPS
jgi:hypothetical protein